MNERSEGTGERGAGRKRGLPLSDEELVGQCLEGDGRAWEILLDRYRRGVWNVAYQRLQDLEEARRKSEATSNQSSRLNGTQSSVGLTRETTLSPTRRTA